MRLLMALIAVFSVMGCASNDAYFGKLSQAVKEQVK